MLTPIIRMCLAGFVMDAAVQVAFMAVPFFIIRVLHGDAALTGLAGAAQAISYAAVCMVSSRFVGRLSNGLHAAVLGAAIFTVAFSAIPFFPSKTACLALISLGSVGLALFWPATHSWVGSDPDPRTRTRKMMWFTQRKSRNCRGLDLVDLIDLIDNSKKITTPVRWSIWSTGSIRSGRRSGGRKKSPGFTGGL